MDWTFMFYGEAETGPPIATREGSFPSKMDADAWAHGIYKSLGARGYMLYEKGNETNVERWDERRNATWP